MVKTLAGMPDALAPKDRIVVPYRITCIKSLLQEEEEGSGGGCASGACGCPAAAAD